MLYQERFKTPIAACAHLVLQLISAIVKLTILQNRHLLLLLSSHS